MDEQDLELLRRRDAVFTNNSRAGARDYARWLEVPEDRITVLHNGFEFPKIRPERDAAALKRSLGIPAAAPVVADWLAAPAITAWLDQPPIKPARPPY